MMPGSSRMQHRDGEDGGHEGSDDNTLLQPEGLVLAGQLVVADTTDATPLYQMNWNVTSIPQKGSSVIFERIERPTQQNQHIFYLAHPLGAQYETGTPTYYITSTSPDMLGNISLESSKPRFQKPDFKALLSVNKSASDDPLFDESSEPLFHVKPKWMGGHYAWSDTEGRQIAQEDRCGDKPRITVAKPMEKRTRDALVALWCLRLWYDTAESRRARKDALERMTPPEAVMEGHQDNRMGKRMGALGSLAGAGA
ncbi:hypothetical protein F4810DRAFT_103338 [Camillea tinctor]|nr:hypothetical protein F4810DRAFT_103338 [Camillea tinctor]